MALSDARVALPAGALGALGVATLLPRGFEPGLRGTLVVLPLVAALFAALARRLAAPRWPLAERWLAAGWLALALATPALGIPGAQRLAVGGFVLLVAGRVLALLPPLRRRGARGDATWPFALLPFAAGLALLPWTNAAAPPTGDEPYYLLLAESLAADHDLDLANQFADGAAGRVTDVPLAPQFEEGRTGERYSRHGVLLPLLLVPFWKAGGVLGARLALLAAGALLAERLYRLARAAGARPRGAFRAWAVAAFALPALPYARSIWAEVPAALAAAVALEAWLAIRAAAERPAAATVARLVAALALLPLIKARLVPVALPLAAVSALGWPARDRRRLLAPGAVLAVALAGLAANARLLPHALGQQEAGALRLFDQPPVHYLTALVGLFGDTAFGLLPLAPLWLLALPGAATLVRRERAARWAFLATAPYLVLVLRRDEWYGGWCPPFRYLVVFVPWLTLALAVALERPLPRAGRRLAAALAIVTAAAAWAVSFEPNWAISPANGRSDLLDVFSWPFGFDLARLAPSAVRPRLATWVWSGAALAATLLVVRGRRRAAPALLSVAAGSLLAAAALAIVAGARLPTRVAEAEDLWIGHSGGSVYPEEWTPDRTRYAGGWVVPVGKRLFLTPRAGGASAEIALRVRTLARPEGEAVLACAVGGRLVGRWRLAPGGDWRVERIAAIPWPRDAAIELRVTGVGGTPPAPVVVDRLEFAWR